MAEYNFREIEQKWQDRWEKDKTFQASNNSTKPKYYALDMFPYPSGAGLHVGHPLGYIASDIVSRFKRLKGFNVLHPIGFDSFGLPTEQYAIQTGQHPAITTDKNITRYKEQLRKVGFSFDWSREVWTSKPDYYRWTQWIFIQLFHAWYNHDAKKAEHIDVLIKKFEANGNAGINAACDDDVVPFTAAEWKAFSEKEKSNTLLKYRLTYLAETMVNWCPALGTVLANDEVINGVSERGGHPVERKKMMQWMMRITAYASRLLEGLETLDWPEPMKDMQRYWIGKSFGAELDFKVVDKDITLTVFTTRVDTTFGVTYVSIAPEHELIPELTAPEYKEAVQNYVTAAKNRSERDRMSDVKTVSGQFTGTYVINPFNGEKIQLWIADYVLAGYGTGVVMAVPSSDERDFRFATHYKLPIIAVQEGEKTDITKEDFDPKAGTMINSGFLNGLAVPEAIQKAIKFAEEKKVGKARIQYKMRDAIFARQRYWGEPIPIYFKDGIPMTMDEKDLPLLLPEIDEYKPTETGEPPLGRAKDFKYRPSLNKPHPQPLSKGEGSAVYEWETADKTKWEKLKEFSRLNRKNQTESEDILWQELRGSKTGYKFRRQHVVETYIADFINLDKGLIIEVDGEIHNEKEVADKDKGRTGLLEELGYTVLRFTNAEVKSQTKAILEKIKAALNSLPSGGGPGRGPAYPLELSTMPGWAGSSWYFLRYMDPQNENAFVAKDIEKYWNQVDLYIGGSEHATGHLFYSRFWNLFLYDMGFVSSPEPFKKLINQGMIQGRSNFVYRVNGTNKFVSFNLKDQYETTQMHVDVNIVDNDILNTTEFKKWRPDLIDSEFILEDGKYICGHEVEKMSKSKYNVVNPDDICNKYGADTLRMYEMFLGPLEQFKPWNTHGIEGVYKFLRKLWRLFYNEQGKLLVTDQEPTADELKILHKAIKKIEDDIERHSFNTSVPTFMVCVNEFSSMKTSSRKILEDFLVLLTPYAPHITEELWAALGHTESISFANYPKYNEAFLIESEFEYPISINGKVRVKLNFPLDMPAADVEKQVLANEVVQKWLESKAPKKVIVVPGRIVNVVI